MDSNAIRDPDLRTLGRAFDPSLTPLNCGGLAHFYVNLTKARIIWEEGNLIEGGGNDTIRSNSRQVCGALSSLRTDVSGSNPLKAGDPDLYTKAN